MEPDASARNTASRPFKMMRMETKQVPIDEADVYIPMLLFDLLPENAIDNLIRYSSARPKGKLWTTYIDTEELSALNQVNGALGKFMNARFNAICLSTYICAKNENCISVDRIGVAFKTLMRAGENFKTIRFFDTDERHHHGSNLLIQYMRNV